MIAALVAWSARSPWLVMGATLLLATAGGLGARGLTRDIIPDLSDPQIAVVATWMGHPAVQVEAEITHVLSRALAGVSGSTSARAVSMSGMAYLDVVLESASGLDHARKDVAERIAKVHDELPAGVRVDVGPAASSTSWVFQYALVDRSGAVTPLALRRLQDDVLRPALAALPGVAEVASLGGGAQQVTVALRADQLEASGLTFQEIASAIGAALEASAGTSFDSLRALDCGRVGGSRLRLDDVATVTVDEEMPDGIADLDGTWEAVGGIVLARSHADLDSLVARVKETLAAEHTHLPPTVELTTVYDRTELASRAHRTLVGALAEEVAAASIVILAFLLHGRSALIPLLTLPAVLLLTLGGMWILGVPTTIMSLGGIGIALGMAVDADVVALEACHRAMGTPPATGADEPRGVLVAAACTLAPAITTSLVITAVAFLPVFAFTGETGRLLRPLAMTKTLVILSAAVVSLTLAPAIRDRLLRGRVRPEFDNPLTRCLVGLYRPMVHFALANPAMTIVTAGLVVASCLPLVTRLGGEFLPHVDEGDLLFMPTTLPGVKPERAAAKMRQQNRIMIAFPEVQTVFGKVGRADTATDPAPFGMTETIVRLKPRSEWPLVPRRRWYSEWAPPIVARIFGLVWPARTRETTAELVDALDRALRQPGWATAWTAPARARMQMMSTGVRTPVGIRVVASDPTRIEALGSALREIAMRGVGARSAVFESPGGVTHLQFIPDPAAIAAHRVDPAVVQSTADLVIFGGQLGDIVQDGRRLRVQLAPGAPGLRGPADELRDSTVRSGAEGGGQSVPLALLGRPVYESTPAAIRTENGERVAYVYVDLNENVDPYGYVESAQQSLDRALAAEEIQLHPGERIEWTGQYELFTAGARRFAWIAGVVALSMIGLLAIQFRSLIEALIVALSVPFALAGSIWTIFLLGYALSAPVWVGLLTVVGLATQTAVVMVVYIDESFYARVLAGKIRSRDDIVLAHAEGTVKRLRPKVMTITTLAAALLPLLWSDGAGAEIMKRVAAPMVGGILTSAFLTLEVVPVVYTLWRFRQLQDAQRAGKSIEQIIGVAPTWTRARVRIDPGPVRVDGPSA
jgi:Cu(I)/Ag(I) efflux system membrane protein CusA/SilA